jgi:lipoyl(octanoyl) transferase
VGSISIVQLGRIGYAAGLDVQRRAVELRKAGAIGDVLFLLEHTPVITLGRNAKAANVLVSREALARRGVELFECDRGGDVTFHGPGQLVGYPIFDLRGFSRDTGSSSSTHAQEASESESTGWTGRKTLGAVDFVRRMEEALIRTCGDFKIPVKRIAGLTGVWTDAPQEAKIAAIGVHISRGVTSHGFALNVDTDLSFFHLIVPCGIESKPVTSLERELGRNVEMSAVSDSIARSFGSIFGREILWLGNLDALFGSAEGVPMKPPPELREIRCEDDIFFA